MGGWGYRHAGDQGSGAGVGETGTKAVVQVSPFGSLGGFQAFRKAIQQHLAMTETLNPKPLGHLATLGPPPQLGK